MATGPAQFLGNTVGEAGAFAAGLAVSPVLHPIVQALANEAWSTDPTKPLEPGLIAQAVAHGHIDEAIGAKEAALTGISAKRFDELVKAAKTGPGIASAFALWRRDKISEGQFRGALRLTGMQDGWIDLIVKLFQEILTPGELAAAIHRGLVPDPGLLRGEQPTGPFKVEAYPVYSIDAIAEALGSGYDHDRLGVLVGLQGLPMGTHEAAQALFRGIITHGDYIRAFNESNSRNEWAQAVLDQTRQIPTARDFMENALRGYSNLAAALKGAERHGMSEADATLIYQNQGRPMNIHAITQALARGAKFHPEPGEITDPYHASIVEGPVKPAYYEMAESLKYTLPSTFAMRQLASSGVWSEAKTAERLKWAGWYPQDADEAAAAWTSAKTAASTNPWLDKAKQQWWTAAHKAFVKGGEPRSMIEPVLTLLAPDLADRDAIFQWWTDERAVDAGSAAAP